MIDASKPLAAMDLCSLGLQGKMTEIQFRERMMSDVTNDPMAFLRNLWGNAGIPLPGLVTPTLDVNELDKRITDMKAVEGWLKLNLNMLQMSIQAIEVQRATLAALQAVSQSVKDNEPASNPFANPALWPWNLVQPNASAAAESASPAKPKKPPKA